MSLSTTSLNFTSNKKYKKFGYGMNIFSFWVMMSSEYDHKKPKIDLQLRHVCRKRVQKLGMIELQLRISTLSKNYSRWQFADGKDDSDQK